jgi:LysM repeat protein
MTGPAPDNPVEVPSTAPATSGPEPLEADESRSVADRVREVCPYLLAEDGVSRRLGPWRSHRCMAVRPPGRLAIDKQQRLCLVAAHETCTTFLAARGIDARLARLTAPAPDLERVTRWSIARATASVLEPGTRLEGIANRLSGTLAQAILGGALLVALIAMARGQFIPGTAANASPSPSTAPSVAASADASASPSTEPSEAGPTVTPEATPVLTAAPSATPAVSTPVVTPQPTGSSIYTVRSGDTLWDLAIRFNTTVKALQQLNGIGPNDALHVGQKLQIP